MSLYVMEKFCDFFTIIRPSDLITTLTYVLMDNFCPCLITTLRLIIPPNLMNFNLKKVLIKLTKNI